MNKYKGKLHSPPLRFTKMTLTPPLVLKHIPTSLKFSSNIQTSPFHINTVNFPLILSSQYPFREPPGDRQTENAQLMTVKTNLSCCFHDFVLSINKHRC